MFFFEICDKVARSFLTTRRRELKIKVVSFDWNGTLLNDSVWAFEGVKEVFRHFKKPLPTIEEYRKGAEESFATFYQRRGIKSPRELLDRIINKKLASLPPPKLFYDTSSTLRFFRKRNIKTALISSHKEQMLISDIAFYKIESLFDFVRGNAVNKTVSLEELIDYFKVEPREVVYVTDTAEDIIFAKSAGVIACAIPRGYNSMKKLIEAKPDYLISYLRELKYVFHSNKS